MSSIYSKLSNLILSGDYEFEIYKLTNECCDESLEDGKNELFNSLFSSYCAT